MGLCWRSKEQDEFFDQHLPTYVRGFDEKTLKDDFWPHIIEEWFEKWPLSPPSDDLVEKEGSVEKATKVLRTRKVDVSINITSDAKHDPNLPPQQQIKRTFKTKGNDNSALLRNLGLEDGLPRKKSEVQMYMILYYETRIRETVVKRWAEDHVPSLESRDEVREPDEEIEPHESFDLTDPKIPISFKNSIAQTLYNAEPEVFKAEVRRQREAWHSDNNVKTVRTNDEDERLTLVRQYQKYVRI
jgi:hypothetical protein